MGIKTLALNTFRETIRDRILYSLLVFAIFMIGLSYFLSELSVGDFERIVINFGLTFVHIFGAIIAIFIGITLVNKEVEKKTVYSIVSKPISRLEFLLGKFFGLGTTLLVTVSLMVVGCIAMLYLQSGKISSGLFLPVAMMYLELLLLTGIAILFSTFTTSTLSAVFTLSVFFIGHLSPQLKYFGSRAKSVLLKYFAYGVYYFLPNLENFNMKNVVLYQTEISSAECFNVVVYFFAYLCITFLCAYFIFNRRDFK